MKIGFIGGGNMASAIIGGMIEKKVYASDQVMAHIFFLAAGCN